MSQKKICKKIATGPSHRGWVRRVVGPVALLAVLVSVSVGKAAPGALDAVDVTELADGLTRVEIATSSRPTFTTWKLDQPARVVVEITGVVPGSIDVPFDADTFAVGTVAATAIGGDGGARTRVMLTLRRRAEYQVRAEGRKIVVDVTPWEKPSRVATVAVPASDPKALQQARQAAELAEARARKAEQEVQRLADVTRKLAEENAALERSRSVAETAQKEAERTAAALERQAQQVKNSEGARTAAERKQIEREQAALALRRAEAEKARSAADAAVQRLEQEKRSLEERRGEAEKARGAARELVQRLNEDRTNVEKVRAEAEAVRARAEETERHARKLLAQAEASQKEAEARARTASQQSVEIARNEVQAARRETEAARQAAEQARVAVTKLEQERKRLHDERTALARQQSELESMTAEAARVEGEAQKAQARAAEVQKTLALLEQERRQVQQEKDALARKEAEQKARLDAESRRVHDEKEALAHREAEQRAHQEELRRSALALQERQQALQAAEQKLVRDQQQNASDVRQQDALKAEVERLREKLADAEKANRASAEKLAAATAPPAASPRTPPRPAFVRSTPSADFVSTPGRSTDAAGRPRSITLRVPRQVSRIDFVDEPARSSVIIDLDEPAEFSVLKNNGRRLTLRLHHADLPRGLERSLDASEFLGPVRLISSYRDPNSREVVVDVDLVENVPNRVRTDGARIYWDFHKSRHGSAATTRPLPGVEFEKHNVKVAAFNTGPLPFLYSQATSERRPTRTKRYTGRRIDLDFKGADIHNILRLLSDVGNVNIVTSDDVRGEVTIKMRDVPWDQALDVVLRAKNLGQIREGNLIRIAPMQVLEKEMEQEIQRQKQAVEVAPTETRLIGVSYAEATQLQERAKDLLSPRGKVSVDDRTNNLIVSDVSANLGLVEDLVRNLDTQTSQVVIEARIVEARSTFVRQLGIQWGGSAFMDPEHGNPTGLVFPNAIGVGGGATDQAGTPIRGLVPAPRTGVTTGPNALDPNFAVNLPAAVGGGSGGAIGLTLGSLAGAFNLNIRLSALESTGQVRILSSPRISTMDNVEASIEQGVSIPISVVSAQGVQTVFVDAKLNLTVKPHVTNEGTVILKVNVTRNEPDFVNTGARGDPTILKKEARTMMLVRDGDTAVIGGIYQRNSGLSYSKVPFFADIPILGYFFRSRRENDDRTEFLVFITPRIANRTRSLAR